VRDRDPALSVGAAAVVGGGGADVSGTWSAEVVVAAGGVVGEVGASAELAVDDGGTGELELDVVEDPVRSVVRDPVTFKARPAGARPGGWPNPIKSAATMAATRPKTTLDSTIRLRAGMRRPRKAATRLIPSRLIATDSISARTAPVPEGPRGGSPRRPASISP
jgi:hypothetical protein